jgi:hypothetical protein
VNLAGIHVKGALVKKRLLTGNWRLATRDWRLATRDWRLATRNHRMLHLAEEREPGVPLGPLPLQVG